MQRIAAVVVLLVVLSAVAFAVGRATANTHHSPAVVTPSSITSSGSPTRCAIHHPC